jgi:hypothetical protein
MSCLPLRRLSGSSPCVVLLIPSHTPWGDFTPRGGPLPLGGSGLPLCVIVVPQGYREPDRCMNARVPNQTSMPSPTKGSVTA